MPNAQLSDESVDGSNLDTLAATGVSQSSGFDMVVQVGHDDGKQREGSDDFVLRFRTVEALKELLQDETGRDDDIAAGERALE